MAKFEYWMVHAPAHHQRSFLLFVCNGDSTKLRDYSGGVERVVGQPSAAEILKVTSVGRTRFKEAPRTVADVAHWARRTQVLNSLHLTAQLAGAPDFPTVPGVNPDPSAARSVEPTKPAGPASFAAWSLRWLELAGTGGSTDVDASINRLVELWSAPIPGAWRRGIDNQLLRERYRRGDRNSPRAGEHLMEWDILDEDKSAVRCMGLTVLDGVNAVPLVRDECGGRRANVEADLLLLLGGPTGHRLAVVEMKSTANDAWYAAVENLRELKLLLSNEAQHRLFQLRGRVGTLPAAVPLIGLVVAPRAYYEKASAAAATRLFERFRREVGVEVHLATWDPVCRAIASFDAAALDVRSTISGGRVDAAGRAFRGSQMQIQLYCARHLDRLTTATREVLPDLRSSAVRWVSPLESEHFGEYKDDDFLSVLGLSRLTSELKKFWPRNGPTWDALGRVTLAGGNEGVVLVEAKAHPAEIYGGGCGAGVASRAKIEMAMASTQRWLGVNVPLERWLDPLPGQPMSAVYQSANRLAVLYWLREVVDVPAWLINVYFVDDRSYRPTTRATWDAALPVVAGRLGLESPAPYTATVFLPGRERAELVNPPA